MCEGCGGGGKGWGRGRVLVDVIARVNEWEKVCPVSTPKFDYTECCYAGSLPWSSYTIRERV